MVERLTFSWDSMQSEKATYFCLYRIYYDSIHMTNPAVQNKNNISAIQNTKIKLDDTKLD